jgi:hypothetical protein
MTRAMTTAGTGTARRRATVNANPKLLALPLALPRQRRTRDPLPETLVRQLLRRRPQMDLDLTDEQVALLVAELDRIIDGDRYPLSARIRALREIRAVLKPYPERPPLPAPTKPYEPPSRGRYKKRR